MKTYLNYVILALFLGLSSLGKLHAMDGAAVPPAGAASTFDWRVPATFVGTAAAYYGYDFASNYVPVAPMAAAGVAALGMYYIPKLWKAAQQQWQDSEGIRRVFSDVNARAKEGGYKKVMREGAKDAAFGAGEGAKEGFGEPLINLAGDKIAPYAKSFGNKLDSVSNGLKYLKWISIGAAGLLGLYVGTKILHNYFEKPRLEVIVKKAHQNGTIGMLSRQIIVDDQTRDRLNLFLLTNLKVKQSIMGGNEEARYRTALLWGPSGCGKRMFAQEMANFARMDYYEIPASSFHKFKDAELGQAIEDFFKHDVVKSQNGAVVYIDNAQMLFSPTISGASGSSNYSHMRTTLIEQIEARSTKFLVVFGMTSKPSLAQDTALIVDDVIEVSLPKLPERKRILKHYRDLYFNGEGISEDTARAVNTMLDDNALDTLAKRLDKASSSELASFMNTLKIEAMLPTSEGLTPTLVAQLIDRSEHRFEQGIV